ncbi:trypsin-like peptidase domain-containing protein, partial [bacterium]|nr:trypsin-like peptidase domain-containing protein [bacterium]
MNQLLALLSIGLSLLALQGCANEEPKTALASLELQPSTVETKKTEQRSSTNNEISASRSTAITRTVENVSKAVCGINVTQIREYRRSRYNDDPFFRFFFPERIPQAVKSFGSGFLISQDGFILTNEHVVHNAAEIVVVLPDGSTHEAEVIGDDYITDIALLRIKGDSFDHVELGNSDDIIIGEWVIAVGNPFGLVEINSKPTVTVGVVSATDRDFGKQKTSNRVYQDMIQTDAAINPGNSGGPLVNSLGQVIGINTFIYTGGNYSSGSIGLGFAIPVNRIKRVLNELKQNGEVNRRFWSGLEVDDITELVARYFRLKTRNGVIVTNVTKGSPAAKAGLEIGDIIFEMNNTPIRSRNDIWAVIEDSDLRGGDQLEMMVIRDRKKLKIALKLA